MSRNGRLMPWAQVAGIAWAAPQVVAYRVARIAAGDRREVRLMVTEKIAAVAEIAAVVASPRRRTVGAVLEPVHRRVMANRRRLARG